MMEPLFVNSFPNKFSSETTKPTEEGLGVPVVIPEQKNYFYSDSSKYTICKRNALGILEDGTLMTKISRFRTS